MEEPITIIPSDQQTNPQDQVVTKATLMKYLILFASGSLVVSIILGAFFGGLTAALVNKFFPNQSIESQPLKVENEQSAIINSVKKANPAVVSVIISAQVANTDPTNPFNPFGFLNGGGSSDNSGGSSSTQEVGGGSGFIITSDGYILTNKHVASSTSQQYTVIMTNGKQYSAKIVAQDPTNDLAILKIDATGLPTVTLGSSSTLQLGQQVIAIGNALGQYANTVSAGVVSGVNRVVTASDPEGTSTETLNGVIQTDAQINPGNSGGPLLNLEGQVIGIDTAVAQNAQGIGFAIPIDQAKSDIQSVEKSGTIVKPELGVRYQSIDSSFAAANPTLNLPYNYGAYVSTDSAGDPAVISGSPADKAGIKAGDIILEVNGVKIDNVDNTLTSLIQQHNVGDTVTLQVYDSGSVKNVQVTLNQSFSSTPQ